MARWLTVLEAFLTRDEWGVRELAEISGLPKSAVHRILHEMARLDVLARGERPGTFRVGAALNRLVTVLSERTDLNRIAKPFLERAAEASGETTILGVYAAHRRQYWAADAVDGVHPIVWTWKDLQEWNDLHVGAGGKGILAFLPPSEQEAIIDGLTEPIGSLRPQTKAELTAQLADIRRLGYALSRGERTVGSVAVAAPIRDARGQVVGEILTGWPESRSSPERERELCQVTAEAAEAVSRALGYQG